MAPADPSTLSALLRRRDLDLRLVSTAADLPDGALDRPLRWVHSSDLADPTPFLAEDLVLLTTGTQFDDAEAIAPTSSASPSAACWGSDSGPTCIAREHRKS